MYPQLGNFNAGNAIGYPANPDQTGPLYPGAVSANASPIYLPAGWTVARTPSKPVGWYRITHNLNSPLYFVVVSTRNDSKALIEPDTYAPNFFDVNTSVLPSDADADKDFAFLMVAKPAS